MREPGPHARGGPVRGRARTARRPTRIRPTGRNIAAMLWASVASTPAQYRPRISVRRSAAARRGCRAANRPSPAATPRHRQRRSFAGSSRKNLCRSGWAMIGVVPRPRSQPTSSGARPGIGGLPGEFQQRERRTVAQVAVEPGLELPAVERRSRTPGSRNRAGPPGGRPASASASLNPSTCGRTRSPGHAEVPVAVRRGDDVGDPVRDREPGHRQGFFQGGRSVVDAGQDVTVQVEHSLIMRAARPPIP